MKPRTLTLNLSSLSLSTRQYWLVWLELSLHARYISKCLPLPICFSAHIKLVQGYIFIPILQMRKWAEATLSFRLCHNRQSVPPQDILFHVGKHRVDHFFFLDLSFPFCCHMGMVMSAILG